ncbi:hypothetical protein ACHAO9_012166 [Fusarium lateritium]
MPPSDTQDYEAASEAIDQNPLAIGEDQNGANKRDTAEERATANDESFERPVKKMKRGKYISRACAREEIHADNASQNNFLVNPLLQEADNKAVAIQGLIPLEVKTSLVTP